MTKPFMPSALEDAVYGALKRALFRLDPERAHRVANRVLRRAQGPGVTRWLLQAPKADGRLAMDLFGVHFDHPLGVAAGFDKEAEVYNALLALGFGHVEVGTVTPQAQPGNAPPRMQRLPHQRALVNRLGFPGPGMDAVDARMRRHPPTGPVAINIGPNKDTSADHVADALARVAQRLAPHAEYFAINVSSPNTPGLRDLQSPDAVARLVTRTLEAVDGTDHDVEVVVKVHPDAPADEVLTVARSAVDAGASGIIAVNTTQQRAPGTEDAMDGGLSGAPLLDRATRMVSHLHHGLGRDATIIGVGGVFTGNDAFRLIQAGASLVQTYTGFIYEGPRMPVKVQRGLLRCLDDAGLDRIEEAVGTA